MARSAVDITIPIRAWDFDRFEVSLASYRQFWWLPHHIHLFARPEEKGECERRFKASDVSVWDKSEICGPAFEIPGGWFRAQVTKMAASQVVEGDFYLPSDPDIIITREITPETFFREGKAPYYERRGLSESVTRCEPQRFYADKAIEHSWKPMASALGLPMPLRLVPRMVTPLSAHIMKRALGVLASMTITGDWRVLWREFTRDMRPSDFALYFLVAHVRLRILEHYHYELPFLGRNVRTSEEAATWKPDECFGNDDWMAMAIESKSGITPEQLQERLSPWIPSLKGC